MLHISFYQIRQTGSAGLKLLWVTDRTCWIWKYFPNIFGHWFVLVYFSELSLWKLHFQLFEINKSAVKMSNKSWFPKTKQFSQTFFCKGRSQLNPAVTYLMLFPICAIFLLTSTKNSWKLQKKNRAYCLWMLYVNACCLCYRYSSNLNFGKGSCRTYWIVLYTCIGLGDLIPFLQFKNREQNREI